MKATHILCGMIAVSILHGPVGMMAAAKTQILTGPTEVQGVPCQGKFELSEHGRIKSCTLARDHAIAGCSLPTGTAVRFNETGEVESCVLGQQATIEGFILPAGSTVRFRGKPWTSNRAVSCTLLQDTLIRGVPLPANSAVHFWTNPPWMTKRFDREVPDSWECFLSTDTLIQGRLCHSKRDDGFGDFLYPSGKLREVSLAQDVEIDGVPCTSSQNPLRMGIRVLVYALDSCAWFYENGHLEQGLVSRDCTIEGRKFKRGDIVRLTPEGTLDATVGTTLGAFSRLSSKRTPPESYIPSSGNGAMLVPAIATATVDGLKIHASSTGQAKQTLIFIHGWTCDSTSWAGQVPEFYKKYHVVTVDLPGHGQSESPENGKFSMNLFARAVEAVRDEAKADKVVLIGHSMGVVVIRQYARLHPEHVAGLVAVDGPLLLAQPGRAQQMELTGPEGLRVRENMIRSMFTPRTPLPLQQQILAMMLKTPEATAVGAFAAMFDPAIWKDEVMTTPGLAVYSGRGTIPNADDLKKRLPNFTATRIDGTGHFVMMEQPKEFNRLLTEFLESIKF
jgi:pimeloyl-ACP methyl ester carboxylesterase